MHILSGMHICNLQYRIYHDWIYILGLLHNNTIEILLLEREEPYYHSTIQEVYRNRLLFTKPKL
jgi:hypothetical protein